LGPFSEKHVASLTPAQLDAFEVLLDQPDQDLYEWIVEKTVTPPEFDGDLMALIKAFRFEAYEARGDDHGG
jgi:antitoxin CptB